MMKGFFSRPSILEEILEVEDEIKKIRMTPTYRKIVYNLRQLNRMGFGSPVRMTIPSPDNLSKNLEVRRHSKEIKEIMYKYEELQLGYRTKINDLRKRRKNLEKQLFR